ncbi:MAG TPA: hypothetical protein VF153_00120 [Candidatus Limnocylindria bacterium]
MDPGQRRLAERRLVHALQRLHRTEPMVPDFRLDAVVAAARAVPRAAAGHRGSAELTVSDAQLRAVMDALVASGRVARVGHRVSLRDYQPRLDPNLRDRVDRLLGGLREAGAQPPRLEGIAARLGITPPLLEQLRRSGELVSVAPGIDFPADVWSALTARLDAMGSSLNVARVRDELRTSRRHAEAILAFRRAQQRSGGRGSRGRRQVR